MSQDRDFQKPARCRGDQQAADANHHESGPNATRTF